MPGKCWVSLACNPCSVEGSDSYDCPTNPPGHGRKFPAYQAAFWRPMGSGHYCAFLTPRDPQKGYVVAPEGATYPRRAKLEQNPQDFRSILSSKPPRPSSWQCPSCWLTAGRDGMWVSGSICRMGLVPPGWAAAVGVTSTTDSFRDARYLPCLQIIR